MAGEGKSTVSCNLAAALAQRGRRVLLVDADLRSAGIQEQLGMRPGRNTVFATGAAQYSRYQPIQALPNLHVVPTGFRPTDPHEVLDTARVKQLMEAWSAEYDHVIIDTPPVLLFADVLVMAARADGVIFVTRSGKSRIKASARAREVLTRAGANMLGFVLNSTKRREYYYQYPAEYKRLMSESAEKTAAAADHTFGLVSADGMLKIQSMNIEASRGINMMLRFGLFVIAVAMAGAVCDAQKQDVSASTSATAETSNLANAHPLRLSSGDLLDVKVLGTTDPDFSPKLRVDETGSISIPYAGPVKVAGRTAEDAGLLIEATYRDKDVLKNPHVSVTVLEYATQGVTVGGEVKNPGVYPLLGTHNLLDLLAAAGGVTPTAGKGVTISHRDDPTHPQVVNVETKPGSAVHSTWIFVRATRLSCQRPASFTSLVTWGSQAAFLIENSDRLTVLQAVALAQGTNRTASLDHTKLIRKTSGGHSETQIALKKILSDKSEDQLLADGDILFVPSSGPKNALRDVESILPSAAGAAIYHVP